MRDDFSETDKRILASRVGWRCSNPGCRAYTTGPSQDLKLSVSVGIAAHITAASPEGPRYEAGLSHEERGSIENGIWLCEICARKIDDDQKRFSAETLRLWKIDSEEIANREIGRPQEPDRTLQPIRFSKIGVSDQCLWGPAHRFHKIPLQEGLRLDFGFHELPEREWSELHQSPEKCTIDPVLDIVIVNDSGHTGTVSAVGIELLYPWMALKGLGVAHKVPVEDVYIIELKKLEPNVPQVIELKDPVAVPSDIAFRYLIWLNGFHNAIGENESIIRLVVVYEGNIYRSRMVYMGVY